MFNVQKQFVKIMNKVFDKKNSLTIIFNGVWVCFFFCQLVRLERRCTFSNARLGRKIN